MVFIRKYYKQMLLSLLIIVAIMLLIFYGNKTKKDEIISESIIKTTTTSFKKDNVKRNTIYVDVKGAVLKPGVYEIENDKRVIDAINLAGGLLEVSDTINLNLSRRLTDEMYIVVYTKEEIYNYEKNKTQKDCPSFECVCPDVTNDACITNDVSKEKTDTNNKISINNSSKEELMTVPGIGEVKANSIIEYRTQNGGFKTLEEVKNVSGIGDSTYEKIKEYISLE